MVSPLDLELAEQTKLATWIVSPKHLLAVLPYLAYVGESRGSNPGLRDCQSSTFLTKLPPGGIF